VVVGQDWGGPLAAGVAQAQPQRVRGAVFGNTALLSPKQPIRATSFHRLSHVPWLSDLLFRGLNFPVGFLHRVQGDRASIGPLERRAYAYPFRHRGDRLGPLALARMVPHRDGHPSLPALQRIDDWVRGFSGPVELVWGDRDPILGRACHRLEHTFQNVRVTHTQAGHFLQEEVPDALAAAIRRVAGTG
jgi:haloalkane dehalogenase